ncbi:MAG: hypothetical protein M3O22_04220 [Pseudomonadota bacterium]|nr:hypothetical protein [Pseudomonadota bacterium]
MWRRIEKSINRIFPGYRVLSDMGFLTLAFCLGKLEGRYENPASEGQTVWEKACTDPDHALSLVESLIDGVDSESAPATISVHADLAVQCLARSGPLDREAQTGEGYPVGRTPTDVLRYFQTMRDHACQVEEPASPDCQGSLIEMLGPKYGITP